MRIEIGKFKPWKPLWKLKPWTICLLLLAVVDSIFTIFIGGEHSFIILWAMSTFNWTLAQAMVMRLFYLLPLLYFLDKQTDLSKFTFLLYLLIYLGFSGAQFL
jgi:hypothetical protein